jgi:hypothetical protein
MFFLSHWFIPAQSSPANSQPLAVQQAGKLPDANTIAKHVRQDAIAQKKVDNTAKVIRVERVGRGEIWMYNPVPYWKVTIADQHQQLVYFTNDAGTFRRLMQRNGQNVHSPGQPAQEVLPPEMISAAIFKKTDLNSMT